LIANTNSEKTWANAPTHVTEPAAFHEILAWLDPDREAAGKIYVQLREDLARVFTWSHCSDAEGLTDEVFDRVGKRVRHLRQTYQGDPRRYFYGVARYVIKESAKKVKTQVSVDDLSLAANSAVQEEDETWKMREDCLQSCLQTLSSEKRELILAYYAKELQAKIDHRVEIARRLGISLQTLRVRVYRIRAALEQCIEHCLDGKAVQNEMNCPDCH
jgi:RNA polymerase sigma factor (sigma-70 family)